MIIGEAVRPRRLAATLITNAGNCTIEKVAKGRDRPRVVAQQSNRARWANSPVSGKVHEKLRTAI